MLKFLLPASMFNWLFTFFDASKLTLPQAVFFNVAFPGFPWYPMVSPSQGGVMVFLQLDDFGTRLCISKHHSLSRPGP